MGGSARASFLAQLIHVSICLSTVLRNRDKAIEQWLLPYCLFAILGALGEILRNSYNFMHITSAVYQYLHDRGTLILCILLKMRNN